jgi:hypothetical protein
VVAAPAPVRRSPRYPLLVAGAGLAVGAAGAVALAVSQSAYASLQRECAPICSPARYQLDQALQPAGAALIAVGAVALAAALVIWLIPSRAQSAH